QPGTLDPWGNTQARKQRAASRRLLLAVPLTLLALGGVAAFWVMRSDLDSAHAPTSATPLAPGPPNADSESTPPLVVKESAPRSTPGPIVTPVDPSEVPDGDDDGRGTTPARAPVVRGPLPKPAVPAPVIAPALAPPPASGAPIDPPAPSEPPTPASDVSDFGGRR